MSDVFNDSLSQYLMDEETFESDVLSLNPSIDKLASYDRFVSVSSEQLEELLSHRIPEATQLKVNWAMRLFNDWLTNWRTNLDDGCLKVYKELYEMDKSDLNHCLKFFLPSIRKTNGKTIHQEH